ncbi:hypothetical protein CANARDRAFT_30753, partial [[Candida] arabinofermentans NRRL YB-2248]
IFPCSMSATTTLLGCINRIIELLRIDRLVLMAGLFIKGEQIVPIIPLTGYLCFHSPYLFNMYYMSN